MGMIGGWGGGYVKHQIRLLHTKYTSFESCGFREEDYFHMAGHQRGPPRGFGDSGRRAIYFQGFGEKGHLFSGIWGVY